MPTGARIRGNGLSRLRKGPSSPAYGDAGLKNFEIVYKPLVDHWMLYHNTGMNPCLLIGEVSENTQHRPAH